MTINSVDYGPRAATVIVDEPQRFFSAGIDMAGGVTSLDFGIVRQMIPVTFRALTTTQKNALKAYLVDTIKPYNTVSITPDTDDDLQIGATSATDLTFISFSARWRAYNVWEVNIMFQYTGTDTTV